jgi:hypothetical protein
MGVAVHTGEVIVGNIGSERRTKYGVVGSAVNHAGRIESFTVGGQVLISDATLGEAGEEVHVGERLAVDAKGTREPIVVYDLRGVGESEVPGAPDLMRPLAVPLNVLCYVVVGKRVQSEAFGGRLTGLSLRSASLITPRRLRTLSNVKLELRPLGRVPLEIYAKVLHVASDGSIALRFTPLRPDTQAWVEEHLASQPGGDASG